MKIAPQYRAEMNVNGYNIAVLRDRPGFLMHGKYTLEELHRDLVEFERLGEADAELRAIYPDINPAATRIISKAVDDLNSGKEVDLENLLRY